MATLDDIITPISQGTYFNTLMDGHKANGVPVASWTSPRNTGLSLTQIAAQLFAALRLIISQTARSAFIDYAEKAGLTLFSKSQYQNTRNPPQFAVGKMVLSSVATAPAYTWVAGDLTVGTPGNGAASLLYVNTDGGTLAPGGTLTLTFQALNPGVAWNIPTGSPLEMKTSYAGVSVSNPAFAAGTWIVQQGNDEEGDERLKLRDVSRWGTLGVSGNADAMVFWALQIPVGYTSSPVARAKIFAGFWAGAMALNSAITVCVIGSAGALPPADVAAVQRNFDLPIPSMDAAIPGLGTLGRKYPLTTRLQVVTATNKTINLVGVVYVLRPSNAQLADVEAAVTAALTAYQGTLDIGQSVYVIKVAGVIETAAPFATAIRNVDLSGMGAVITQGITEYPILNTASLAYVYVDS